MSESQARPDAPHDVDDWDEGDVQAFNENQGERLRESLRDEARLDADQEEALDALRPDDEDTTETVELVDTDVEVAVRAHTNVEIETKMDAISSEAESGSPDLENIREEMIDVICLLVVDDEYADRELWTAYAAEYGLSYIMRTVEAVTAPVFDELEAIEQQRSFRGNR